MPSPLWPPPAAISSTCASRSVESRSCAEIRSARLTTCGGVADVDGPPDDEPALPPLEPPTSPSLAAPVSATSSSSSSFSTSSASSPRRPPSLLASAPPVPGVSSVELSPCVTGPEARVAWPEARLIEGAGHRVPFAKTSFMSPEPSVGSHEDGIGAQSMPASSSGSSGARRIARAGPEHLAVWLMSRYSSGTDPPHHVTPQPARAGVAHDAFQRVGHASNARELDAEAIVVTLWAHLILEVADPRLKGRRTAVCALQHAAPARGELVAQARAAGCGLTEQGG